MKRKNIKLKFITSVLSLIMLFSISSFAYAAPSDGKTIDTAANIKSQLKCNPRKVWKDNNLHSELQSLVNEKIITKEQADKIASFIKDRKEKKKSEIDKLKDLSKEKKQKYIEEHFMNKPDLFEDLVSSGIITKEQAAAIKTRIHKKYRSRIQEVLKSEVAKGTIKQDQLDKINEFITKKQEERKAKLANIKNMTETERKTYFSEKHRQKTNLMSELVSEGIITKEQKEALEKAFKEDYKNSRGN